MARSVHTLRTRKMWKVLHTTVRKYIPLADSKVIEGLAREYDYSWKAISLADTRALRVYILPYLLNMNIRGIDLFINDLCMDIKAIALKNR